MSFPIAFGPAAPELLKEVKKRNREEDQSPEETSHIEKKRRALGKAQRVSSNCFYQREQRFFPCENFWRTEQASASLCSSKKGLQGKKIAPIPGEMNLKTLSQDVVLSCLEKKTTTDKSSLPKPDFSFSTPPYEPLSPVRKRMPFSVIPPTPRKFSAQSSKKPLFSDKLETKSASLKILFPNLEEISIPNYSVSSYKEENLPLRLIVKQMSSKDCGAAASLMVLSDLEAKYPKMVTLNKPFASWLTNAYLYDGDKLVSGLSQVIDKQITPKHEKIPTKTPLSFIEDKLQTTGLPVITAITHPKVGGHWIVVDHISKTDVFIREPYFGKAYRVPKDEMVENYEDIEESMIFFSVLRK